MYCIVVQLFVTADVDDTDVRAHVGVHVDHRAEGVRRRERGGRRQGEGRERQVRLPRRVNDDRLHEPAAAVRHDEGRQQPRLQGLRSSYSTRVRSQVCGFLRH